MEGKRFIHNIKIKNLLSFDEEGIDLELHPINVLVGPNGSGKSNFLHVLSILQAAPTKFTEPMSRGGGAYDWFNKSKKAFEPASIAVQIAAFGKVKRLRYVLKFVLSGTKVHIVEESIDNRSLSQPRYTQEGTLYYYVTDGEARIRRVLPGENQKTLAAGWPINPNGTILSQRNAPESYPELGYIRDKFDSIHLYLDWNIGHGALPREAQPAELQSDFLLEDARNLAHVLDDLFHNNIEHDRFLKHLRDLYPRIQDLYPSIKAGFVKLEFRESGLRERLASSRISDGSLRFICLLAILLHPSPPPLICIEEPELGLHPDMIHKIAELLVEASARTQIIVTTHSNLLVSALSDHPEAIVICEHDGKGTRMNRLEPDKLKDWLKNYNNNLGELWLRGHIGGTRW